MPRVKIDTPGVTVEIDANEVSSKELCEQALQLYRDAGGWPQTEHTPVGFAATDRRWTPDHRDPNYMSDYGFAPVKASDEIKDRLK